MRKHSLSPWRIEGALIIDADNNAVCAVSSTSANAQLIASAPELLEACQAFIEAYTKSLQLEKTDVAVRLAQQTIQKATGGT